MGDASPSFGPGRAAGGLRPPRGGCLPAAFRSETGRRPRPLRVGRLPAPPPGTALTLSAPRSAGMPPPKGRAHPPVGAAPRRRPPCGYGVSRLPDAAGEWTASALRTRPGVSGGDTIFADAETAGGNGVGVYPVASQVRRNPESRAPGQTGRACRSWVRRTLRRNAPQAGLPGHGPQRGGPAVSVGRQGRDDARPSRVRRNPFPPVLRHHLRARPRNLLGGEPAIRSARPRGYGGTQTAPDGRTGRVPRGADEPASSWRTGWGCARSSRVRRTPGKAHEPSTADPAS